MTQDWNQSVKDRAERAADGLKSFVATIAALRHPQTGCPWDLQQDHVSLRRFMIEEAYEAAEAMLGQDSAHLIEELGDVLLQVVLNAQLSAEDGRGDIADVIQGINQKMVRRHPHVFASSGNSISSADVKTQWEEIKQKEKEKEKEKSDQRIFAKARKVHPSLTQSFQIGKVAKSIDFDWDKPLDVLNQLRSELDELEKELVASNTAKIADELGDCFFSLAQLARHLGYEAEDVAQRGNLKFLKRFDALEDLATKKGIKPEGRDVLEALWQEAKSLENKKEP